VREVRRIARPRDEVVHDAVAADLPAAVEAARALMLAQHASEPLEPATLGAEQELAEVGVAEQRAIRSDAADLPHPGAADGVEHDAVQRAERSRYAGQKADRAGVELGAAIQELVGLTADGLKLPQRHRLHDA